MTSRSPVTLIIPTVHHRAALYRRALRHLSDAGFRGPIVVSDHSPPEHSGVIARVTEAHAELDMRLLRHAPEAHFLTRLSLCAGAAETPYVHLHADDDFLVVSALGPLVGELERAQDCAAAMGISLRLKYKKQKTHFLHKTAIEPQDPFARLVAQLESYSSVLYALRRREELIASMSFAVARCPDVQFWQYLESCVAAIKGRFMVLDVLHYVRSSHHDSWSSSLVRERSPDHFPHLILSQWFQPRVAAFRAALIEACEVNGVPVQDIALDEGLIHLLYRGLGAMGMPLRRTSKQPKAPGRTADARPALPGILESEDMLRILDLAGASSDPRPRPAASDGVEGAAGSRASAPVAENGFEASKRLASTTLPGRPYTDVLSLIHARLRPRTYLEIGVARGRTLALAGPRTNVIGVDPAPDIRVSLGKNVRIVQSSSDEFFARQDVWALLGHERIDLAFIDGMHRFEFALRDFAAVERLADPRGTILLHDCYPLDRRSAERVRRTTFWSGDCWRLVLALKKHRPDLAIATIATPPTGLAVVRGLDPDSTVLMERMQAIVAEFLVVDYGVLDQDKPGMLNLYPNDPARIRALLSSTTRAVDVGPPAAVRTVPERPAT